MCLKPLCQILPDTLSYIKNLDKAVCIIPNFTFRSFLDFQQMTAAIGNLTCKRAVLIGINANAPFFSLRINIDFSNAIFDSRQSIR